MNISMYIHVKYVDMDMDMDMDVKFHINGNPELHIPISVLLLLLFLFVVSCIFKIYFFLFGNAILKLLSLLCCCVSFSVLLDGV